MLAESIMIRRSTVATLRTLQKIQVNCQEQVSKISKDKGTKQHFQRNLLNGMNSKERFQRTIFEAKFKVKTSKTLY